MGKHGSGLRAHSKDSPISLNLLNLLISLRKISILPEPGAPHPGRTKESQALIKNMRKGDHHECLH